MRKLPFARVRLIESRQLPRKFGPAYLAAQLATPREGPSVSRPRQTYSAKLQRLVHAMSVTEHQVAPLALHHPGVFELWDQHMLNPRPENHPAQGHPNARSLMLPTTSGTLRIAERMGALRRHPFVRDPATGEFVPVPLLGDLLLFLMDDLGPYCVEWDVKRNEGAHGLPLCGNELHASSREVANARFKYELRVAYLQELAIRIVPIHLGTFDAMLLRNLKRLCDVHSTPSPLQPELQYEIIETFREALPSAQPPSSVIAKYVRRGVRSACITELLDQAIWHRNLKVDLFQEVRCDLPLCPQVIDPFEHYRELFARLGS